MMNTKIKSLFQFAVLTFAAGFGGMQAAGAASVDLASVPLISGLSKVVPPNIYFILDDSGSMDDEFMPDSVDNDNAKNCFKNFGYNRIYYNPSITYVPPKKADGTSYTNSTFTAARTDGFNAASATTNLSATQAVTFNLGNNPYTATNGSKTVTVAHTNHGFAAGAVVSFSPSSTFRGVTVNGSYTIVTVSTNSYTITVANNATSNGTGGGNNRVETSARPIYVYYQYTSTPLTPPATCQADSSYTMKAPTTAAEKTNFANWYSFYRKRILMMKSSSGRAFATVDDKYRVGFSTISETGTGAAEFLNIKKFDGTQKSAWYTKLYAASAADYTPLRGALSKAGRLYAGKLVSGSSDPVQYSCQQNFTILTTDGYWNIDDEVTSGSPKYSAYKEDNTTLVGDQDGVAGTQRPYLDARKDPNTLADIAMYYYKSDLRPLGSTGGLLDDGTGPLDVSSDNVPTAGADTATWQHMTTFTIGLGVSGTLGYAENYPTGGSPDYQAILQGTKNWPDPLTNPLSGSSTVTTRIDDLWHAAVNGRGLYLSASNPDSVVSALSKTLAAISVSNASAAAAATSSLEPVAGDNFAYVAQYTTGLWYGDVQARDIDLVTGALSATVSWSASTQLNSKVAAASDTRTIKYFSPGAASKLKDFTQANLTADSFNLNYFKSDGSNPNGALTQYGTWNSAQQTAATVDAMIGFLRGRSGSEDQTGNTNRLFRDRTNPFGDVVDASPVFVKKPPFKYTDTGYAAFASANANRTPVVYVGANDGMLHAFDAATGNELWAYIPSEALPQLYRLADAGYANNHRFYVDGPTTVGDAYDGSAWKTILIGGLGGGGKSYYALDVTDPANPKALWEFGTSQDGDMGYSYGNAVLTKRSSDGRWVVVFTSGYNNTGGDSKGRLFVVDAFTGARLAEIITDNSVTDANQSGIGKINNYVLNTLVDNTTQYVYGGDLGGALWRFDIDANSSQRLGRTSATVGNQPITVRPEIARIKDSSGTYHRAIYFGTGRYLGLSDISATAPSQIVQQAIYSVKDTGADLGVLTASGAKLVSQTLDTSASPRTIPNPVAVDWYLKNGWYVTLPVGERVNVDMRLQLGTLVTLSNAPKDDYCTVGGSSWLYALDYKSGIAVSSQNSRSVGFPVGASIASGLTLIRLPNNKLIAIVTQADTTVKAMDVPVAPGAATSVRRVGWREIF